MRIQCLPMMRQLQLLVYAPLAALMIFYDNEFKILVSTQGEYVYVIYLCVVFRKCEKRTRADMINKMFIIYTSFYFY